MILNCGRASCPPSCAAGRTRVFSRKARYALHACIFLARHEDKGPLLIESIARGESLPRKFIEVILLDLRHAGLLQSKKGRGGGYQLARSAASIKVGEVLKAIDGPPIPFRCVVIRDDKTCEECHSAGICPIRGLMRDARDQLNSVLLHRSLADMANEAVRLERDAKQTPEMFHI